MYYFYILKSNKLRKCYYGFTNDLKKRLKEHNSGKSKYTSAGMPWQLVYYEAYSNKDDAKNREKNIKLRKNAYKLLRKRIQKSIEL